MKLYGFKNIRVFTKFLPKMFAFPIFFNALPLSISYAAKEGIYIFKLAKLHTTYESSLKTLNITSSINRTRLKRELVEHFQEHGMQEQSDGKHVIFVFPEGMHSLLRNISLPSQINSEVLQLARVAKIIHSEIFQVEKAFEFANKLPPNCQIVCPTA